MATLKTLFFRPKSERHFTSFMPLEECLEKLLILSNDRVVIELIHGDVDTVFFTAAFQPGGMVSAEVTGELLRWEEVFTRVNCEGRITSDLGKNTLRLALLMSATVIPILLIFIGKLGIIPLLLFLLVGVGSVAIWMLIAETNLPESPDELLNQIERALKDYSHSDAH